MSSKRPRRTLGRAIRDDFEDETGVRWTPAKWFLTFLLILAVIGLTVYVVGWLTQPLRTAAGVRERVANPDNVLYTYERFHDLCAAVVADDGRIKAKEEEIAAYDKRHPEGDPSDQFQAAPKRDRLDTELTGLKQHRAEIVAQYNADSAKANRSLFKDRSLPERLDESTPACN